MSSERGSLYCALQAQIEKKIMIMMVMRRASMSNVSDEGAMFAMRIRR